MDHHKPLLKNEHRATFERAGPKLQLRRDDIKRVTMTLQSFLKTLKATKRTYPCSIYNLLICSSSTTQSPNSPEKPISDLSLSTLRRIVSDPDIKSSKTHLFSLSDPISEVLTRAEAAETRHSQVPFSRYRL